MKTIQDYIESLVPNIEKHLHAFIALSDQKHRLRVLQEVFFQFKEELSQHLKKLKHTGTYPHELYAI